MAKNKKPNKIHTFDISPTQYDENLKEYKSVLLDGKEIFRLDQSTYMGHKRNQTPEVLEVLSKLLKREVSKDELQRAITLGTLG